MTKAEIRNIYRQKRKELSPAEKDKLEDLVLIRFQQSGIHIPSNIMAYAWSEKLNELDPSLIIRYCAFINPEVVFYFPVINGTEMYVAATDDDTEFDLNEFGIEQPVNAKIISAESIEMILIPLLAFDKSGNRVGYGKGYYDRFLADCKEDVLKVGLSYFNPIDKIDNINDLDIAIDYAITPEQCFSFK